MKLGGDFVCVHIAAAAVSVHGEHTMRVVVGFPPRDRTGFVEERQLDLPRIFGGFVANPQFCYSSSQAPQAAISNCEGSRVHKREIAIVGNPNLGFRDPIGNCPDLHHIILDQ